MISYRRFRNTDPPALVDLWNDALVGRGAYPLRSPGLLERWIFSKTYFDPEGLIVAESSDPPRVVGFSLSGFGPNPAENGLDYSRGIICAVITHQSVRRQGIGRELVRRAEAYLHAKGTTRVRFGSAAPDNPYLFGLYGGANSPGVLESEPNAAPFLHAVGYAPVHRRLIYQKSLDSPLAVADVRFVGLRRRFEAQLILRGAVAESWWQECVWGTLEPSELKVFDKLTNKLVARAVVWDLEGFSWRWGQPSAGIFDLWVREEFRRQGLAKLVLLDILRFLQEQFFGIAELQIRDNDTAALGLCQSLGFEPVDAGAVWEKQDPSLTPETTAAAETEATPRH